MSRVALLLCIFALFCTSVHLSASHNRAGEITYEHAPREGEPFRYEFSIITYTKTGGQSDAADRDSLEIFWGDGTSTMLPRTNGPGAPQGVGSGELLGNQIKKNEYKGIHTYSGFFFYYVVHMKDPNRINNIININDGASEEPFVIQDTLFLLDPQFYGYNNSPVLYQPPLDYGNVGYTFVHNPNAYDLDGDSLYFELIPPRRDIDENCTNYFDPNFISAGPDNNITLDNQSGEFTWDSPQQAGIYNIAFLITEYRNGLKIGSMVRDMQIIVEEVDNRPPELIALQDTCVQIGQSLEILVVGEDPDTGQDVTLTAYGGPLEVINPATFQVEVGQGNIAEGLFNWDTTCDHIFSDEYTLVFKAEDDFVSGGNPLPLVDLETWQITVVPPAPTGLQATAINGDVLLEWDSPYICEGTDKFQGFSVYRAVGCDSTEFDICQRGLIGSNYTRIATDIDAYTYTDETAVRGLFYSYRIIADFADVLTGSNFGINLVASHPSENQCVELPLDIPILSNVSIEITDENSGEVFISWQKPDPEALDTIANPGPYTYELKRLEPGGEVSLGIFQSPTFSAEVQTTFTDTDRNTVAGPFTYTVGFSSGEEFLDDSEPAESPFLSLTASDNQLLLEWTENVPWFNFEYRIYRFDDQSSDWLQIGASTVPSYLDDELVNGRTYCYYVECLGTYASAYFPDTLYNLSQQLCGFPIDTQPPCAPELEVSNICDDIDTDTEDIFQNRLSWTNPNLSCADDVLSYNIYYGFADADTSLSLITSIEGANTTAFLDELESSLAGCYAITAVDSFQNESIWSNVVCKENCPLYELPNVFTPNGDGSNDRFVPLRGQRFVSSIKLEVFNRWGNKVFETTDPAINWEGPAEDSGTGDGVYFYTCQVYQTNSFGIEVQFDELSGYIHVMR